MKNSKRIFNPHMDYHKMSRPASMNNFKFSELKRQSISKTPISFIYKFIG